MSASRRLLLALLFSGLGLPGCSKDTAKGFSTDLPSTPTTPTTPTVPAASVALPLQISINTYYTGITTANPLTFASGATSCAATDATPNVTCVVTVPEGRVYYSDFEFSYSWLPSKCKLMTFTPYSYLASNAAGYTPPGADNAVDCSDPQVTKKPSTCFGGAAKTMVAGFPKFNNLMHLSDDAALTTAQSRSMRLPSSWTLLNPPNSNRPVVNDLPTGKRGTNFTSAQLGGRGDGYVQNTFQDYTWTCRDDWYDPQTYSITLTINEEDTSGLPNNLVTDWFYSWKEAP